MEIVETDAKEYYGWKYVEIDEKIWKNGNRWKYMEIYGN